MAHSPATLHPRACGSFLYLPQISFHFGDVQASFHSVAMLLPCWG